LKAVAVIPARMGSSRFPGKPLADLLGRPMLEHVYRRVSRSQSLGATYIATCDEAIRAAAEGFGAPVLMTSSVHERASDRVAEAAEAIDADLIVMVQGDEPMTRPEMIDQAVAPFLADPDIACVNLMKGIDSEADFRDPNTIKVVVDRYSNAVFMSRQAIPTMPASGFDPAVALKQVCIIPFRRELLKTYARLPPTPLEQLESIDMLRLIEHGYRVRMVPTDCHSQAVDTPQDLARVAELMAADAKLSPA
jgi:3-deoxy-manno-octulosonate cytidylyltransferase (CMP-KDO synthetase)